MFIKLSFLIVLLFRCISAVTASSEPVAAAPTPSVTKPLPSGSEQSREPSLPKPVATVIPDTDGELEDEEFDPMMDVEPDDTPEEIAAREQHQVDQPQLSEQAVPLIVEQFGEAVIISDEAEEPAAEVVLPY